MSKEEEYCEKPVIEKGHFFNEKQKAVKQKIMEECLDGLFKNLEANQILFDNPQAALDLIFSVLVMFNREVLVHTVTATGCINNRKDIMKNLFETIKNEVNRVIKERMI